MKTKVSFVIFLLALAVSAWAAPPKIAVLDVVIPKGVDVSVQIPITESIIEQMVRSNKYTVLDRGNIAAIFKERDFQLSGEVTDADITKAGQFLGAAFVVVTKVQVIGTTYFLSSKVIDAKTAIIVAQTSDKYKGDIAELISLAQNVGYKLANGVNDVPVGAIPIATTTTTTTVPPPLFSDYQPTTSKELPSFRVMIAGNAPNFFGTFYDDNIKTPADRFYDYKQNLVGGFEVYAVINLDETFYIMGEYDSLKLGLTGVKAKGGQSVSDSSSMFTLDNLLFGVGVSRALSFARPYAGVFLGNTHMKMGDFWSNPGVQFDPAVYSAGTNKDQLIVGAELGTSFYLFNFVVLEARARVGTFVPDFGGQTNGLAFFSISVGGGIAF